MGVLNPNPYNPNPYHLLESQEGIVGEVVRFSRKNPNQTPPGCLGYMEALLSGAKDIPPESIPPEARYGTFASGVSNLERFVMVAKPNYDSNHLANLAKPVNRLSPCYREEDIVNAAFAEISNIVEKIYQGDRDWDFMPWYHDEPRFVMSIGEGCNHSVEIGIEKVIGGYSIRISTSIFNGSLEDGEPRGHWEPKYETNIPITITTTGVKIDKKRFERLYNEAVAALGSGNGKE